MPNLEFDETTHLYTLGDQKLLSVTQSISILDTRWRDPWYLERGRLIHLACEYYDRDELDESTVDLQIRPYLDAYVKFLLDTKFKITAIEYRLSHPTLFYAGTLDRIGILNQNEVLIDIKSGAKVDTDELQGAGYWELCRANGTSIKKVFDLYLRENGTYSLVEIKNPKLLLPVFLACLKIIQWKEKL